MDHDSSRLDNYIVIKTLGKGATAKVKSVRDPNTNQIFAAKIMKKTSDTLSNRFREILSTEIENLNRINHPNIVNIIGSNESGTYSKKNGSGSYMCMYMILELCQHGELFDVLFNTGRFSEPVSRFYFKQIIQAIGDCHAAGIAHRDLKPENILFDSSFNLKLADFGFSIMLTGRDGSGVLHTRLGTESYMAPEVLQRRPYTGEQADIFSIGIILFIMLSQNPPFSRADPNDAYYKKLYNGDETFWARHSQNKPPGFYSAEFKDLIGKMLALDPSRRLTVNEIKQHSWYNGHAASAEEVRMEIGNRKAKMVEAAERAKNQRRANPAGVAYTGGRYYRGDLAESEGLTLSFSVNEEFFSKPYVKDADPYKYSQILTGLVPREFMTIVSNELGKLEASREKTSPNSIKISLTTDTDFLCFKMTIFKTLEDLYLLDFTLEEGTHFDLMKIVKGIEEKILNVQEC